MKNPNQVLMGLAVVGLLGGSVAVSNAAPSLGTSGADGDSSVPSTEGLTLGNRLWIDADLNGRQDPGEVGIDGATVTLIGAGGDGVFGTGDDTTQSMVTSGDGNYLFEDLDAGRYRVITTDIPAGLTPVVDPDSGQANPDGISELMLTADTDLQNFGFGSTTGAATIGDTIFLDFDGDGIQGVGEPGFAGQLVTLTGPDGTTVETTTDANGNYSFTGLADGTYVVTVVGGIADAATNTGDPDGGTANTSTVTIVGEIDDLDQDFGYQGNARIGDTVFNDANLDGIDDGAGSDPRLAGVEVTVTYLGADERRGGGDDTVIGVFVTDANGNYLATNLPGGRYSVDVTGGVPAGLDITYDPQGPDSPNGRSEVRVRDGGQNLDQDFGYGGTIEPLGSIGDTIFNDTNGDGVQDADEPGLSNVTVTLTGAGPDGVFGTPDDTTDTTDTDANGNYSFDDLPAGDYVVTVDTDDLPAGAVNTFDEDGNNDSQTPVSLTPGEDRDTVDFGYQTPAPLLGSIGDTIFFDENNNGVQDDPDMDPGIDGVVVRLTGNGPDGVAGTADDIDLTDTTESGGLYLFENLPAGDYQVTVESGVPAGYSNTIDPDGLDDATSAVTLGAGEDNLDQDFGYAGTGSISGTIYNDANGDFDQDGPDESGISGVTVTLTGAGDDGILGTPDDTIRTEVTGPDGSYSFENLPADEYTITITDGVPDGTVNTEDPDGTSDATTAVSLGLGDNVTVQDFGFSTVDPDGSVIGDRVWLDLNADGVQDAGEAGINGVTVTLTGAGDDGVLGTADDTTETTDTAGDGDYLFDELADGDYIVTVTGGVPAGLVPTFDDDGGLDETSETTLVGSDLDQDFGYVGTGSIGDTVYLDTNGDGTQGDPADEPGLEGVTVTLTGPGPDGVDGTADDVEETATTDANGNYLFDDLLPGDYTVTVEGGLVDDLDNTGDPDGGNDSTSDVTLGAGEDNLDQDFGYEPNASMLGDRVWLDVNSDGVQDDGEPGINGVTVTLTGAGADGVLGTADDTTETTVTAGDGDYLFDELADGDYIVSVTDGVPADLAPTFDADGGLDETSETTLVGSDLMQDFGYAGTGSIGDTVYLDTNGDGTQGDPADEPGLEGVTVALTGPGPDGVEGTDDDVEESATTDANGNYLFDELLPGDYTVTVEGGLPDSVENSGDPDGGNDSTSDVTLGAGDDNLDQDFGYEPDGSILGDRVWLDVDSDGVQDDGEPGINGVTVQLTEAGADGVFDTADDVIVGLADTVGDGDYLFDGLADGEYRVEVLSGVPADLLPTYDADSGVVAPDEVSETSLVGSDLMQDFGYAGTGSIGDAIFLDSNGDGIADPGEGISGVDVTVTYLGPDGVLGTDDDVVFETTTDDNGNYSVDGLPAGDYVVTVDTDDLPDGVEPSVDPDGGDDSTSAVTLAPGETNDDQDFGYVGSGSIAGTIFTDDDGDGIQGPDEEGLEGVTVTLTGPGPDGVEGTPDDVEETTTTDENGDYLFDDLPAGEYTITVEGGLPDNVENTGDPDGTNDSTTTVTLGASEDLTDQDFGYQPDGSILGDRVWLDLNADGVQDDGEPGINSVTVTLTEAGVDGVLGTADDVVIGTQETAGDGDYLFDELADGDYRVVVTDGIPDGLVPTFDADGGLDQASETTLVDSDLLQDFGYVGTGSIGDLITVDGAGIEGVDVTVTYLGPDGILGTDDDVVFETTTDDNGNYSVDGLPAGDYVVTVDTDDLPDGVVPSEDPDGGDDSTSAVTLAPGETNDDQDFGYTSLGSIGDTVYLDTDGDGTQGDPADEPGVAGVTVTLTGPGPDGVDGTADDVNESTTTDADGKYLFDDLPAGDYTVTVSGGIADELVNSGDPDGGGDSTSDVTLGASEDNLDQDFGYEAVTAVLGDRVWIDNNMDGVQDDDEPGIPGVTVTAVYSPGGIFGAGDDVTFTDVTDADGNYLFEDLPSGEYTVTVTSGVPAGLAPTFDADSGLVDPDETSQTTLDVIDLEQDFGYVELGSIGDTVYLDVDGDGTQGDPADEPGISGAIVTLTGPGPDGVDGTDDDVDESTTTDSDGAYLFEDLYPGDYTVTVSGAVEAFDNTGDPDGAAVGSGDSTSDVTLGAGEDNLDQDFGYQATSALGDRVWYDQNRDGVQDPGEPGIDDVAVVAVFAGADGVFGTADDTSTATLTANDGYYLFENIADGPYRVSVLNGIPTEFDPTFDADSGIVNPNETSELVLDTLDLDQDFGYAADGSIGDTIYIDANGNGVQDEGELGIPGVDVTVEYVDPSSPFGSPLVVTVTTDDNGKYLVENLPAGDFTVTVDTDDLPAGYGNSADPDGGNDDTSAVTLGSGEQNLDQDFGYEPLSSIGDTIYLDLNGDGDQDVGEPGVPGQTVTLTGPGPDGVVGTADDVDETTTTDENGNYLFDGLGDGDYVVTVVDGIVDDAVNSGDPDGGTPNESAVTIVDGTSDLEQDFGYVGDNTIGDTIWFDTNSDGIDDGAATEPRLEGVEVTVTWAGIDDVVGTDDDVTYPAYVTDTDGEYLATNLPDGTYTVAVTDGVPTGLAQTADPDAVLDETSTVAVAGGQTDLDQDFGYAGTGSIEGTIFIDTDGDGVQDPDEPGVPGVTVVVTGAGDDGVIGTDDDTVQTVVTDDDGNYVADGLPADTYQVDVTGGLPDGATNTADPDGVNDSSTIVELGDGETVTDQDFGYQADSLLGDRVWLDLDSDGVQDDGEPGINGVDVTAFAPGVDGVLGTADDVEAGTTTTSGDGDYLFTDLQDGPYRVVIGGDSVDALAPTFDSDGGLDNASETDLVTVDLDQDFGLVGNSSLAGTIWLDTDGDGVIDPDEALLGGVDVAVLWFGPDGVVGGGDDVLIAVTTNDDGTYSVDGLPAGNYAVQLQEDTLPEGLDVTFDSVGGLADPSSTTLVQLGDNEDLTDVDFGTQGTASLGDTVYFDRNGDRMQNADEVGIEGVDVTVTWAGPDGVFGNDDDEVFETTTDENGNYLVDKLPAGDFVVQVDGSTLPPGMTNTVDQDGNNDGQTPVTLATGEARDDIDFGYRGDGTIGDTIYLDLDGDGVQDPNEPGLAAQPVTLTWAGEDGVLGTDDDEVFETTTDANGKYLFEGLPDGDYVVATDAPAGYVNTGDPDGGTPSESNVTIANGADDLDQDFGFQGSNALAGTIVDDTNGNGVEDAGEPGIEGVDIVVTWSGPDGVLGTDDDVVFPPVTTDANGDYALDGLPDGVYSVDVVEATVPADAVITYDPDGANDGTTDVPLSGGQTVDDVDFGYTDATGTIGDTVWLDLDGDGIRDLGEPGLAGATVTLTYLGEDGVLGTADDAVYTTTVDGAGNYLFENLPAGDFSIVITDVPAGLRPTADPDGGIAFRADVTLAAGETNLDQDFGFVGASAVGDTIFIDTNGNGVQNAGEAGIAGLTVTVRSAGLDGVLGTADDIIVTAVTDADGKYFVDKLPAGPTRVSYDASGLPTGYNPTSDLDGGNFTSATVTLAPNETNLDVDFAVGGTGTINGTVYEDDNANGFQDPGEAGIPGVTIIVIQNGPDGPIEIPVVTDSNGDYEVDNLPPGDYTVDVDRSTLPPGVIVADGSPTVNVPAGGVVTVDVPAVPEGTVEIPAIGPPLPAPPVDPTLPLPATGTAIRGLLMAAFVLVLIGGSLLASRRRSGKGARTSGL